MTLKELLKQKQTRIKQIPDELFSGVTKAQNQIFDDIIARLDSLKKSDGKIILSVANSSVAKTINDDLSEILNSSDYVDAVTNFASEFDQDRKINEEYFKKAFPDFQTTDLQELVFQNAKKEAVELLAGSTIETGFLQGIKDLINTAVESQDTIKNLISVIRDYAIGDGELNGKLLQYSKQVAFDSIATADRAFTNAVSEDLGAEWFLFSGVDVAGTRDFCHQRKGNFYHFKEIESWAELDWQGKNPTTNKQNIYILLGGFNCLDSLMPVSISSVPIEDIQRNIDNGNFTPSDFEKTELGL